MRVNLEAELRPLQRFKVRMMKLVTGTEHIPGPIITMSYDPQLFGRQFSAALEQAMRKMKHWSVGEVELFAAFVSKQNQCAY
jgi:hypothetical protein